MVANFILQEEKVLLEIGKEAKIILFQERGSLKLLFKNRFSKVSGQLFPFRPSRKTISFLEKILGYQEFNQPDQFNFGRWNGNFIFNPTLDEPYVFTFPGDVFRFTADEIRSLKTVFEEYVSS